METGWYNVSNAEEIPSPALLVYPQRIEFNIRHMVEMVNADVSRLRPHVKTHKMFPILRMQLEAGITKFKASTIAELELCAEAGAPDVLLAYQPVGPTIKRLANIIERYPDTKISVIVDSSTVAGQLSDRFAESPLNVLVDIDCGMHRTGILPAGAKALCDIINGLPGLNFRGLHAYDGHIHASSLEEREDLFNRAMDPVCELVEEIQPAQVVSGGSPTFALHAKYTPWECSPGTTLLWDAGYGSNYEDLGFEVAATVLTRVISRPGSTRLTLDLGHKAVAGENPLDNRVRFPDYPDMEFRAHSEEHLVVKTAWASEVPYGTELYGIPWHICPTVALHAEAWVIRSGAYTGERWSVRARDRMLTC